MDHFLELGALNRNTGLYEFPSQATKKTKYGCYSCKGDVSFCSGKIRRKYFRHVSASQCSHHDEKRQTESDIHLSAQHLLKSKLDGKSNIEIVRECSRCKGKTPVLKLTPQDYQDTTIAVLEYTFVYNGSNKRADVALLTGDDRLLFEIYHTHKTKETDRPEPWFEFNATKLLEQYSSPDEGVFLTCIRDYFCPPCEKIRRREQFELNQKAIRKQRQIQWWKDRKSKSISRIRAWCQNRWLVSQWRRRKAREAQEREDRLRMEHEERESRKWAKEQEKKAIQERKLRKIRVVKTKGMPEKIRLTEGEYRQFKKTRTVLPVMT